LNSYDDGDAPLKSVDGDYPNIEVYINSLVYDIISAQNEDGIATANQEIEMIKPAEETIKMYFNNTEHSLVVSHSECIIDIRVYSITGQLLVNRNFNGEEIRVDVSDLQKGIYIVSVRDAQNKVYSKKLVKF
jgi:hypothetical protein